MQKYNINELIEFSDSRFNPKVLINEPGRRLMLISMRAGHAIPEHSTPGQVTVHVLHGHVTFCEDDTPCDLRSGELVSMEPSAKHRVEAHMDSVLLVTVTGIRQSADVARDGVEELDIREVPRPLRHPMIFAKFDALPVGEALRLINDHDPVPLNRQFEMIRPGQLLWEYEERGPQLFRIRITRVAPPFSAETPLSASAGNMAAAPMVLPSLPEHDYLNEKQGIGSWLLTLDHKRIAILYLLATSFFFIIGGTAASLIRLELLTPAGDLVSSDTYNKLFSIHGIIMVFFFLVPVAPAVLGNFLIPLMIGARDVAFPRLNLLSWYLFMIGGSFELYMMIFGGVDTGWTFTTPLSTHYVNSNVVSAAMGIFIAGFSSILTGVNFIVTIHRMRAPGMTWFRLPLFIWSYYATSIIFVLATPVIAISMVLIVLERVFGIGVFDPRLGGDPLLFQHLFWFYSHPAVYVMILPGMGIISEVIACFSRKRVFGYTAVAFSSVAIALFSFFVWAHHMFIMGISNYSALVFSVMSMMVAVPSAIKVFNWTFTMQKGSISFDTPMIYALGFLGLFTMGGLTGVFLAALGMDIHLTETYFIVAHFHYVMVGGMVSAYMAGLHFWWPKITGRMYSESMGKLAAVILFIGFNLTFFPQFILGYLGMPRRYHAYPPEFQVLNVLSTAGASVLAIGYILPAFYLMWSLKYGRIAGNNPWRAAGLEWTTQSPPLTTNYTQVPLVTVEAYNYGGIDVPIPVPTV